MKNSKLEKIIPILILVCLGYAFVKLVINDCILGKKVYDNNDIVIKYHRYINVFSVKNDSDDKIYFHYRSGNCPTDAFGEKRKYSKIKYSKRSEEFEIEKGEKFVKWAGMLYDGHLFTVSNEDGLYDSSQYNKLIW